MNNTLTNTIDDHFAVSGYLMEIALRMDPDISNFTPVLKHLQYQLSNYHSKSANGWLLERLQRFRNGLHRIQMYRYMI